MKKYNRKQFQTIQREAFEEGRKQGYKEGYMQSEKDRTDDLHQKLKTIPRRYFYQAQLMEQRIWDDSINPHTEESKKLEQQYLSKER